MKNDIRKSRMVIEQEEYMLAKVRAREIMHELDSEFKVDIDEFDANIEEYLIQQLLLFKKMRIKE